MSRVSLQNQVATDKASSDAILQKTKLELEEALKEIKTLKDSNKDISKTSDDS
jgi:hypothetical protein